MALGAIISGILFAWSLYEAYHLFCAAARNESPAQEDTTNSKTHQQAEDEGQLCSICCADKGDLSCEGDPSHVICRDCFNHYAAGAFQPGGTFGASIVSDGVPSNRGSLPCPFFSAGDCTCAVIPDLQQIRYLKPAVMDQRAQALERMAEEASPPQQVTQGTDEGPISVLLRVVQEAMYLGSSVACPHCGFRGEKDGACMHITCVNISCRRRWCYCCGRSRQGEGGDQCVTCDRNYMFIECFSGWENLQVEQGESSGYAALHEFHRRRTAYFLRRLAEAVPQAPWVELWQQRPDLLRQVPTRNRSITQLDIAAAEPPVFSPTRVEDIRWLNEIDPIIERLRQDLEREQRRQQALEREQRLQDLERKQRLQDLEMEQHPQDLERDRLLRDQREPKDQPPRQHRRRWGFQSLRCRRQRRGEWPASRFDLYGAAENRHVEQLVDEILSNDTLDEELRMVMLESLVGDQTAFPREMVGDHETNSSIPIRVPTVEPTLPDESVFVVDEIRIMEIAQSILLDNGLDEQIRETLLANLVEQRRDPRLDQATGDQGRVS